MTTVMTKLVMSNMVVMVINHGKQRVLFPRDPQFSPMGSGWEIEVEGKQNSLFPVKPVVK